MWLNMDQQKNFKIYFPNNNLSKIIKKIKKINIKQSKLTKFYNDLQ